MPETIESTESVNVITEAQAGIEQMAKNPGIIRTYFESLVPDLFNFALQVIIAIVVYAVGAKIIKMTVKIVRKALERRNTDIGVIQFLSAVIRYSMYFILFMMILNLFGIATTSAVAVLGSCGVAVGLALQGSLANFAGGILILIMRPFGIHDYIVCEGTEGTVQNIGLVYTTLVTVDNRKITIPNGQISNSTVVNVTAQEKRRVDLVVGIGYSSDMKKAKELIRRVYENHPLVLAEDGITVYVNELADSAVMIGVRGWTKTENYWQVRWDVLEGIKEAFDANGIEIPFNQLDVNIKNQ